MKTQKSSKKPATENPTAPASSEQLAPVAPRPFEAKLEVIDISSITRDDTTQIRHAMDEATVDKYAELLRNGGRLPPPVVFEDRLKRLWLADGHHTVGAHQAAGHAEVECEVRDGSRHDAWLFAVKANGRHGLPLTNDDKKKIVASALANKAWAKKNPRQIAAALGGVVSFEMVRKARLLQKSPLEHPEAEAESVASAKPSREHGENGCAPARREEGSHRPAPRTAESSLNGVVNHDDESEPSYFRIADAIDLDHICEVEGGVTVPPLEMAPFSTDGPQAANADATPSDPSHRVIEALRSQPDLQVAYSVNSGMIAVAVRQASGITLYLAQIVSEKTVNDNGSSQGRSAASSAA